MTRYDVTKKEKIKQKKEMPTPPGLEWHLPLQPISALVLPQENEQAERTDLRFPPRAR